MKFCVIGNSHVGMLRAATRAPTGAPGRAGPSLTYFAKAGAGLDKASIRGPVIAAEDPALAAAQARFGMPRAVDVRQYDAVILVAGTASAFAALQLLQGFRVSGWPSQTAGPVASGGATGRGERGERGDRQLLSEAAFVANLADRTRAGVSHYFARAIRRACAVPVIVVPQPYPNERVLETEGPFGFGVRRLHQSGDGAAMAAGLVSAITRAFNEIDDVAVLAQPEETVAHGFLTARAFAQDAVRVDGGTPQDAADFLHVGPAFGTLVLDRVVRALTA